MPESSKPCAKRSGGAAKLSKALNAHDAPFWKRKKLEELTPAEWESLCDGCGRCCLVKLEDEDSGKIHFTSIACKLLDTSTCRCMDYSRRAKKVRDCIKLTPAKIRELDWLPPACAYRLVAEGRDLPWWHPLVSRSPETVHEAGVSVRGRVTAGEQEIPFAAYPDHIVRWPGKAPRSSRRKALPPGHEGNAAREPGSQLDGSAHLRKSS